MSEESTIYPKRRAIIKKIEEYNKRVEDYNKRLKNMSEQNTKKEKDPKKVAAGKKLAKYNKSIKGCMEKSPWYNARVKIAKNRNWGSK